MVSKGEMWVFDLTCITQPQSQACVERDAARVKYPHFTLTHHRVSSSSVVRASVLDHGGLWVQIPSGARIFPSSQWVQL